MDEIIEETKENPVDEETTVEQPQEEKETPNEETNAPEQYSEREKRYYARMKQAENIAKQARDELAKYKKPVSNVDAIIEVQEATKDLSAPEIEELKMRADALKLTLTEARKNEGFSLWQKAYKEKVEKEKAALPSTTVGNVNAPKSFKDMSFEERQKLWRKMGLVTEKHRPAPIE